MARTILVLTDTIGSGDAELGRVLMRNFLYSLARASTPPKRVMFANEGVRLACEGSECLDDLGLALKAGVEVLSCGTCLDYLHLKDKLAVGAVGGMPALVEWMTSGEDVVTVA